MQSNEIRQKFLEFFEKRGHKIVPSSPLVPEGDPSVLFTTAGMQQFKPYFVGQGDPEKDFGGKNTVSIQKCVRTSDIDEVGDDFHLTFFEMLGNFSFGRRPGEASGLEGGYFKQEAIKYAHEFITKELALKIDYVSVFAGDNEVARDEESERYWKNLGITDVKFGSREDNFWGPTGNEGPCGPTTEIYIDGVEIWNLVFNEYYCRPSGALEKLKTLGVDTGMGLERLAVVLQNKKNIFETDLFEPLMRKIGAGDERARRIVADHIKAAVFIIADGIKASKTGRGYVLRRLIRRAVLQGMKINLTRENFLLIIDAVIQKYSSVYLELSGEKIKEEFKKEMETYLKLREKIYSVATPILKRIINDLPDRLTYQDELADTFFNLVTQEGFSYEDLVDITQSIREERGFTRLSEPGLEIIKNKFDERFVKHQQISRTSIAGKFAGGLADHEPQTIKHHTAHHLLLAALQKVLGPNVKQRGSNITQERLRIDFSLDRKMTQDEIVEVEKIVNEKIDESLPVVREEMPKTEAERLGAEMEFGAKYPEVVSVYQIGPSTGSGRAFSLEFCAGPHVKNTSELGHFKILKEEASAAGVRRIKAGLE